jgi:hypothetical protein
MKIVPKLKTSQVAPRGISALLCQVSAATVVSLNVCNGAVATFAVQQKCA